jgi:hypothetical protein
MGHTLLLVIDSHSKWVEVFRVSSTAASVTIAKLRTLFATHGLPQTVVSDNGTGFTSTEFAEFLTKNGIKHVLSPAYHPSSNGLAERAVQTVKNGLKKQQSGNIQCKIDRFLFKYRSTPQSTTGVSPAELLLGRRPRHRLDQIRPSIESKVFGKQQDQANRKDSKSVRVFHPGDAVYVLPKGPGSPWITGFVVKHDGQNVLIVREDGTQLSRHVDHVTRRYNCTPKLAETSTNIPPTISLPETVIRSDTGIKNSVIPSVSDNPDMLKPPEPNVADNVEASKSPESKLRRSTRERKAPERLVQVCSLYSM